MADQWPPMRLPQAWKDPGNLSKGLPVPKPPKTGDETATDHGIHFSFAGYQLAGAWDVCFRGAPGKSEGKGWERAVSASDGYAVSFGGN